MLHHHHPPLPKDESLYNQTAPADVTLEELMEYRKMPTYTTLQKIYHVIMFIIIGIPKAILALCFAIIAGGSYMILCAIWRTMGRPEYFRSPLRQLWAIISRALLFILGFYRQRYHGKVDNDARFIVPNHVCFFDGWHFFRFGPRLIGKREILNIPVMSDVADVFQGFAVNREKSTGISQLLIQSAADPKQPKTLIFPEGASTSGDYMLRFHLGAFLSDLPVQPVTIRYTIWGARREDVHISFFHHSLWMMIVFLGIPAITVDIEFLDPISIKTCGSEEALPRTFADVVSLKIGSKLGVKVLGLGSNSIYKKQQPQPPADAKVKKE